MKILDKILNLLKDKELTSKEIAERLEIPKRNCWVYLNTLYKQGRIIRTTNKRPYKYRRILYLRSPDLIEQYHIGKELASARIAKRNAEEAKKNWLKLFEKEKIARRKEREKLNKTKRYLRKMIREDKLRLKKDLKYYTVKEIFAIEVWVKANI